MIPALNGGQSRLPVFEVPKSALKKRARINNVCTNTLANAVNSYLGTTSTTLSIGQVSLLHAAAKVELSRAFTITEVFRRTLCYGFLLEDIFDWGQRPLSLQSGATASRKDSARTAMAGHLGEATTLLLMDSMDFPFWDHLPTLWTRQRGIVDHSEQVNWPAPITRPSQLSQEPDFIVEKWNRGSFALVESKGHMVTPGARPDYKQPLNDALKQLANWPTYLPATIQASYAVSTYYQESLNGAIDPSLIAFTDPPPEGDRDNDLSIDIPDDAVRRGNYGAWLIGMGFENAGLRLRSYTSTDASNYELAIFSLNGEDYAVHFNRFFCPCLPRHPFDYPWLDMKHYWDLARFWAESIWGGFPVVGIKVSTLRLIEQALKQGSDRESLLDVAPERQRAEIAPTVDGDASQFAGSVLKDGTMFGFIGIDSPFWRELRTKPFRIRASSQ
jgi:hypothetical protein